MGDTRESFRGASPDVESVWVDNPRNRDGHRASWGSSPGCQSLTTEPALPLFPPDGAAGIIRLIEAIRARKDLLLCEWRALCLAHFGAHLALPEQGFLESYLPNLRSALESLALGDADGFVCLCRALGAQLAQANVAFASVVAHLNFLKQAAAKALADTPTEVGQALLLLDRLAGTLIGVAAESYYASANQATATGPRTETFADVVSPPVPSPGFFHGIVGRSAVMRQLYDQIKRIASGTAPVLILGETGTGKELVARAIHQCGPRRSGPFVALNCAALPRDLIESELFGYKRGAFSGAVDDCLGLFRAAGGGTLLLDEITEMAPDLQAKLLRVLQERTVRPVGSTREEPVDARIIASSNRDPEAAMGAQRLRADLYYRLSGSTLVVPPLRQRRDDIAPLVEYHLRRLKQRHEIAATATRGIGFDAMKILEAQPWPGNIRELFNVVEHALTMCRGQHIEPADLGLLPLSAALAPVTPAARELPTFAESERALIERTLAFTAGNKLRAARCLGISRKKLYAKIARYGISAIADGE